MFVCSNRLADAGKSRTEVAIVFAAWAFVYIIGNQILACLVNSRNAARMMMISSAVFASTSIAFIFVQNALFVYAVMGILAAGSSLFFLPFQLFMKAAEPDQNTGVVRSVSLYTFSWSFGFACGPFAAGFIYNAFGWQWCFIMTFLMAVMTAVGVQLLKHHARHHSKADTSSVHFNFDELNYDAMPDIAYVGWFVGGAGCLGVYSLLALLPSIGVFFEFPKSQIGSITAAIYFIQAATGLSLMKSKTWMFRAAPAVSFTSCGLVSMACLVIALMPFAGKIILLSVSLRTLSLYGLAIFYGVFSGAFYFELVFYSLIHPSRSARYVAINEMVVGISGVAGPIIAGFAADTFGFLAYPAMLTILISAAMLFQYIVLKRIADKMHTGINLLQSPVLAK